jgi:hypothetical protein
MQVLALLLLLASAICMVFAFDVPAVAQEASPDEEMTEEDTMEEAEEELVDSPLKQILAGTEPHEIKCKTGQKLVFKASNWRPACINESSFDVLAARGWVASHDPSHEDLMKMQDEYKADVDAEGQAEEEMENETVEDSKETEDEEKTQPRNYSVELKESIDITAP